jgi:hypothetical protein
MYRRVRPSLSAQEAGELLTTLRAAIRQAEDDIIDEAWAYVSNGQRVPADLWARVPGRARIDIQNEQRRRAEGGARRGDSFLIDSLDVMDDRDFARVDLMAIRSALGSSFERMASRQREIREGTQDRTVEQQRTTFNALVTTAENALAPYGLDFTITEGMPDDERRTAVAFRAALQRELQAFQAAGGVTPTADEAQILIGRAWVGMSGDLVTREQGRVQGDRGRSGAPGERGDGRRRGTRVNPTTQVNVPYAAIDPRMSEAIRASLRRRLGDDPTQGEIENAYAAILEAGPRTPADLEQVYSRLIVGGGE